MTWNLKRRNKGNELSTILITGAGRRLGKYLAEQFAGQRHKIITVSRGELDYLDSLPDAQIKHYSLKTYTSESALQLGEQILRENGSIDVIIHNASIYQTDTSGADNFSQFYADLFNVHMAFPAALNEALVCALAQSENGNIIHITDIYVDNPNEEYAYYCSTKAGLESLTKSLAKKYAPDVRVNSVQPGPIKFLPEHSEAEKEKVFAQTLIKKQGGFDVILKAVEFIIDNDYVTGSAIKVDGGRSIKR